MKTPSGVLPSLPGRGPRVGGQGYTSDKKSDGLSAAHSAGPSSWWQVTLSSTRANGSERSNVALPVLDNEEFYPTNVGGAQVVALPRSTTGATRYFAYQYAPRKVSFTASVGF